MRSMLAQDSISHRWLMCSDASVPSSTDCGEGVGLHSLGRRPAPGVWRCQAGRGGGAGSGVTDISGLEFLELFVRTPRSILAPLSKYAYSCLGHYECDQRA